MNPKPGDTAICQMCTEKIEFVGPHWQHTGLPPGVQPRHPAWPREPVPDPDDLEGDAGIVLEYHDAPEDEADPMQSELRERLAAYAHEAWSGWMTYMVFKCAFIHGDGSATIPTEKVQRWMRQAETPYAELPESEKESDRAEADKMLAIGLSLSTMSKPEEAVTMLYSFYPPEWIAQFFDEAMNRRRGGAE